MVRYLTQEQLIMALQRCPGLIPIDLDVDRQQIVWMDLEHYHCYEGFFHRAVRMFRALKQMKTTQDVVELLTSDLTVLHSDKVVTEPIYPTGFVFHAGRSGSTVLTKVLARSHTHLVFGEAAPHNHIWSVLTNNWHSALAGSAEAVRLYKHLLLAMGRKRLTTHQSHFIKFTSFNIVFFDFIHSIFPDVPALFLYRDPADILASFGLNPPGWLRMQQMAMRAFMTGVPAADVQGMAPLTYGARALRNFFSAALQAGAHGLQYLAYEQLTAHNLPTILNALNVATTPAQLVQMQSQCSYDAKTEYRLRTFHANNKAKQPEGIPTISACIHGELQRLHAQLAQSELNIACEVE